MLFSESETGMVYDSNALREGLIWIDEHVEDVTSWEADFIESVAYKYTGGMTPAQARNAKRIIDKYDG